MGVYCSQLNRVVVCLWYKNDTHEAHAAELVTLHQQLKPIEIGSFRQLIKLTAIHHHTISYLTLCVGISVAVYVTVKFRHYTTSKNINPTSIPWQSVSSYVIDQFLERSPFYVGENVQTNVLFAYTYFTFLL